MQKVNKFYLLFFFNFVFHPLKGTFSKNPHGTLHFKKIFKFRNSNFLFSINFKIKFTTKHIFKINK
jgi:hypothetical protein